MDFHIFQVLYLLELAPGMLAFAKSCGLPGLLRASPSTPLDVVLMLRGRITPGLHATEG
jgi:hypothetical protein